MPYVEREGGIVIGLYANEQSWVTEFLAEDHPEVLAFLNPPVDPSLAYSEAIQAHLDVKAQERQYDSLLTAASYVTSTNPQFAAEAAALRDWRDAVWTYATAQLALVLAGEREAPTVAAFLAELPVFAWPA